MPIFYLDSGSIDNLEISSSLLVSGTLTVSGSVQISGGGLTGSLLGTASWATNASTASYINPLNQTAVITGSLFISGAVLELSGALRANDGVIAQTVTASFTGSLTGALIGTASWANNSTSSSFATTSSFSTTASFALSAPSTPAFPFTGSAGITGSLNLIGFQRITFAGSEIFSVSKSNGTPLFSVGDAVGDTLFTVSSLNTPILTVRTDKSVSVSGSLIVTGSITGSLLGTASFATTASYALNAAAGGGSGTGFPFSGSAVITGSIIMSSGSGIFPFLTASEALTAGDFVNIAAGGVRRASNDNTGRQAHGFITASHSTNNPVVVFYAGLNTNETGLTPGSRYFLGTSGAATLTPPTTAGQLSQEVGVAISSTAILVNFGPAVIT